MGVGQGGGRSQRESRIEASPWSLSVAKEGVFLRTKLTMQLACPYIAVIAAFNAFPAPSPAWVCCMCSQALASDMAARLRSAESMKLALLGREAGEVGVACIDIAPSRMLIGAFGTDHRC